MEAASITNRGRGWLVGAGDLSYEVASSAARWPCVQLSYLLQFRLGGQQTPIGALQALLAGVKGWS